MADLSPAEILLDSLVPAQRLIKRLQDILKAPVPYVGIDLSQPTKAKIAAFQDNIQSRIDELTAQREKGVAMIQRIPDQTARMIIELRYGVIGSACQKVPWFEMCELVNYEQRTVFKYHRKGVDQLNQILENGS